jgi:acyl carrier protein
MDVGDKVKAILDQTLGLEGRTASWNDATQLLGSLPELSSIAVLNVLLALEEQFSIVVGDDEMDADNFASVGSLTAFIESKLARGTDAA